MQQVTNTILAFWFGGLDDAAAQVRQPFWFKSTPETDAEIRERFADTLVRVKNGEFDDVAETSDDHLAIVIALDQFPRNIHRNTPDAFATDPLARKWAAKAIERGMDMRQPAPHRRMFFYLPFEHAEDIDDQNEAVRLFEKMGYDDFTDYAKAHRDVIAAYGRFPHRNAILTRVSTKDEEDYLSRPGAGF